MYEISTKCYILQINIKALEMIEYFLLIQLSFSLGCSVVIFHGGLMKTRYCQVFHPLSVKLSGFIGKRIVMCEESLFLMRYEMSEIFQDFPLQRQENVIPCYTSFDL